MKHPLTIAAVGLLVLASACADSTSAEPPVGTDQPPETTAPPETSAPAPTTVAPTPVTEAPEPPPTTAPPTPPPTPEPTTAPTTAPPKPTPPPTTAPPKPTVPPPAENGARCLVGDWVVSDAELDAYYDVIEAGAAYEAIDSNGVIRVSFTETGFTWTNDYRLAMTIADGDYEYVSTGSFSGSYTEANGVLAGTIERDDRLGTVTQDGKPVGDVGDLFVEIFLARPMDSMAFSCDGPVLMLEYGPPAGPRHALHLSPG